MAKFATNMSYEEVMELHSEVPRQDIVYTGSGRTIYPFIHDNGESGSVIVECPCTVTGDQFIDAVYRGVEFEHFKIAIETREEREERERILREMGFDIPERIAGYF